MPTTAENYGNLTVVAVQDGLDSENSSQFREVLSERLQAGARWFVIDFSKAHSLDSEGLETLLWLLDTTKAAGGNVKAAELDKNLQKIFEMTRFDRKMELFGSIHDAVKSLR